MDPNEQSWLAVDIETLDQLDNGYQSLLPSAKSSIRTIK